MGNFFVGEYLYKFRERYVLFNCEPRCNGSKIDQHQCRLAMSTAEFAKGDLKATYSATDNTIYVKQKSNKFNMFVPILGDSVDDDVWLLNYKTVDVSGQKYAKISIHNKSSTIQFPLISYSTMKMNDQIPSKF